MGGVSPASVAITTWQLIKTIISASIPSVFSDVSLLVQKTGATTLPVGHQSTKHDGDGKGRQATIGRRSRQITPRNLYKVRPEGMLNARPLLILNAMIISLSRFWNGTFPPGPSFRTECEWSGLFTRGA